MEAKQELREEQRKRRLRDNRIAITAAVLALALAVILQIAIFVNNPTADETEAIQRDIETSAAAESPAATESPDMPAVPDPSVARDQTLTGTLSLNQQDLGVELDGTKAPQAASVLKVLADSGYYTNRSCHRLTTGESFAVLQCGALDENGQNVPDFSWGPVENTPSDNVYPAGTIAIARVGGDGNSNSTQFFITYRDTTIPTDSAGGYTVVGKVTNGLDTISGLAQAGVQGGESDGKPNIPITIDSFTLN
ncbi:peptidylprolyl isomerase [Acaricomes phytoseiuli]|uniref:peptidylprolyl isomerase n=1 Tax=Acaricomes phytoseiuli TaxID=291968 RepID=UPI0006856C78